jgi:hypothetical protein
MLGLGASLGRGGSAIDPREIRITYSSDFSSGGDLWGLSNSGTNTIAGAQTVDGVADCLKVTIVDDTEFTFRRGSVANATLDDNKDINVSFDMYISSSTASGTSHIYGGFFENQRAFSVTANQWTSVSFTQTLGGVAGGFVGFTQQAADNFALGDYIAIKNYRLTVYA